MSMRRLLARLSIIGLCFGSSRLALSQAANAQADALFRQGRELMVAGKYGEACQAFEASQKIDPAFSTLLNLADCREKNAQLATSWALFLDAERQTRLATDAPTQKLHQVAVDHAARLETRLSKLTISVSDTHTEGLEISRDREVVDPSLWNHGLPIDGGRYTITAHAPNKETWSIQVVVDNEADTKNVDVPLLEPAPPPEKIAPALAPSEPRKPRMNARLVGLGIASVGGASLVAGLVVGGVALSKWHDATSVCGSSLECDNGTDLARAHALASTAHSRGNIASVLFGAGALMAAGGLGIRWLAAGEEDSTRHVVLRPRVETTAVGVEVDARF